MATTKNITMKQFNGTDYDTLYPKTVYNQVSGVAPAGYGLGETLPYIAKTSESGEYDADTVNKTGFFAAKTNTPTGNWCYGLHVNRIDNKAFQLVTGEFSEKEFALRKKIDGVWQPWEWVNPPMQLGVEYRTTERYLGKPVYVKALGLGTMPGASTTKSVSFGTGTEIAIDVTGRMEYDSDTYTIPFDRGNGTSAAIYTHNSQVFLISGANSITSYNAYAVVKYIKTTD